MALTFACSPFLFGIWIQDNSTLIHPNWFLSPCGLFPVQHTNNVVCINTANSGNLIEVTVWKSFNCSDIYCGWWYTRIRSHLASISQLLWRVTAALSATTCTPAQLLHTKKEVNTPEIKKEMQARAIVKYRFWARRCPPVSSHLQSLEGPEGRAAQQHPNLDRVEDDSLHEDWTTTTTFCLTASSGKN